MTISEYRRRTREFLRRSAAVAFAVLLGASVGLIFAPPVHANAIGERYVLGSDSPGGISSIRATRVWIQREGTAWVTPGTHSAAEWLATENFGNQCANFLEQQVECVIQGGYDKYPTGGGPEGCGSGSTGGSVKMFWFDLDENSSTDCFQDITIGSTEGHKIKVTRCGGSDWCFYYDGNLHFETTVAGLGDVAPRAGVAGEFTCDSCMTSSTAMRASYGGTTLPFEVSDKGAARFPSLAGARPSRAAPALASSAVGRRTWPLE